MLALQAKAGGNAQLPLAIMTSGDTHERTQKLLADNAYFGMQPAQVTLLKQEKVSVQLSLSASSFLLHLLFADPGIACRILRSQSPLRITMHGHHGSCHNR